MASLPANVALANIADGANIVASDHRNNYSAIQTFVNALNAILSGGTSGQVLGSSGGTTIGWQAGSTTYRKSTSKAVNTTVAATDLLNGEITVAAGAMGTTGVLRLTAWGDWLQNIGTNQVPPRFQVLLGGTTMIDTGTLAAGGVSSGATRQPWKLSALIQNSAANAQTVELEGKVWSAALSAGTQAFTTGTGQYIGVGNGIHLLEGVNSGLAVDTSSSKALVLNVINGNAGAAYETKLFGAIVEVI